ncbi:MAG: Stk1 family PASTA domain-containing Ser/Thr kinase [Oscillospiraceae bacterium]|nr:Stk1 family PASTA domain-containing Ser/Thr kinase [Oscillospiraceae bacterium]
MDQYIGRLLDNRYEILEIIGTGGMAVVYKARCHRLNRLVAIKILKDEFARDEEFRRRFHAEGEAVAMLSHPNIVQVYDVSTSDSANFIVMELIDGISLKQYMEKKGVLNWKETLHFSMQIAKGLEHAHSRGIVHRDIKPHNVMVLKNGSVKVMDFGIARVMNKSNTLTKEALGSVHYISPEQAKGGHTDNRSDLYSLSVVMYEMMAGRPPYDGESAVSVAIQHINGGASLPSAFNPNLPAGLEQIIMKGMALEIRDRYVSATEMLQDMEEFRKNPAIQFEHRTILDDATRAIPTTGLPLTTAEKKVQAKTGVRPAQAPKVRPNTAVQPRGSIPMNTAGRENDAIRRAQQRRKEEIKKKEEERSRVATTAIVVCSAVAVVAIIFFLVAVFNGFLLNKEKDLVEVPYLVGETYSDHFAAKHKDFTIRLLPQQYDATYAKDQIINQEPAGGEKIQRGSDIWLTVSMGPEPPLIKLDNVVGVDAEEAYKLLESRGFKPLKKKESSYVYEAGLVTRTDPAADTELAEGQTVYIYISTGPDIVEATMPNVVGLEIERAKELMEQMGFANVRYEQVESQKPRDQVIYQSVAKNTVVDVAGEVIIHYSEGPQETAAPSQGETPPPETESVQETTSYTASFLVPERDTEYRLDICISGTKDVVESRMIAPGTTSVMVQVYGSGTMYFDLYVDGEFVRTQDVGLTND